MIPIQKNQNCHSHHSLLRKTIENKISSKIFISYPASQCLRLTTKGRPKGRPESQSCKLANFNDCFFVVSAASFANLVRNHQFAAFAAFYQAGSCDFPALCFSLVSFGFRHSTFGYSHFYTSSSSLKRALKLSNLGSLIVRSHPQSPSFRSLPQIGQRPLQSSLHTTRIGSSPMISLFT